MLDYDPPLYRPPSEGQNLIIQATLGCSFNRCSFCSMYKSKHYISRPLGEVQSDIDRAAQAWPEAQRVFLADGDALAMETDQLLQILQYLHKRLPRLTRVSCYATPINLNRKAPQELLSLRENRLSLLYFGIESGDNQTLKQVVKGATQASIRRAMLKAEAAGMKLSATVVLGLAGKGRWQSHIDGTIELLNSAPATYLSTLQLYLEDRVRQAFLAGFDNRFQPQEDRGILREQARLIAGLKPPKPLVFRSNHASNALALAGNLPRDRERLLAEIGQALQNDHLLRPGNLRGL